MSKPGRNINTKGSTAHSVLPEEGGDCTGQRGGESSRPGAPAAGALLGWLAGRRRSGLCEPEGPPGDRRACCRWPTRPPHLIDHFSWRERPGRLGPPAPASARLPSSLSRAPQPSALMLRDPTAARWPPLLLLLLLQLPPPPLVCGAPAQPGSGSQASELLVPTRLPGSTSELAFHLSAFGQGFVLRLAPDASFLAPEFKIERLGGSGAATGGEPGLRGCFFSGTVNGERDSLAAVSLCRGLSGSFLLAGEEFTIQPQGAGDSLDQPHRLQRWGPGQRREDPGLAAAEVFPLPQGLEWEVEMGKGQGPERSDNEEDREQDKEGLRKETEDSSELPPPLRFKTRSKRFVSEARFVETLLVADASMAAFYGTDLQVGETSTDTNNP